jgi:hypothetical protein
MNKGRQTRDKGNRTINAAVEETMEEHQSTEV